MSSTRGERSLRIWLFLALFAGVVLRFFRLGVPSMWFDELFSRGVALAPTLRDSILQGAVNDMFPPLYPILSHWAVRLPGDAETAARLPSAIAGSAAVLVTYRLGAILHSRKLGVVAAGLLACHWFAIAYSQEARPYALLLLLSSLTAYLALCVVARQRRHQRVRGTCLALGVSGFLLCYLHYIGVLFFAGVGVLLLIVTWSDRSSLRPALWTLGMVGVSYLPWLSTVVSQIERRVTQKAAPSLHGVLRAYSDLLVQRPWLFGLLLLLGFWASRRAPEAAEPSGSSALHERERSVLLTLWVTLPALVTFGLSYAVVPIFTRRNMIVMLPALALIAALALHQIEHAFLRGRPLVSLLLIAGLLLDVVVVKDYYAARKEPFEQFVQQVVAAHTPGEALYVEPHMYTSFVEQYLALQGADLHVSNLHTRAGREPPEGLWILTRDAPPRPPPYYSVVARWTHTPDRRLPWAGQPMSLTRYRRVE